MDVSTQRQEGWHTNTCSACCGYQHMKRTGLRTTQRSTHLLVLLLKLGVAEGQQQAVRLRQRADDAAHQELQLLLQLRRVCEAGLQHGVLQDCQQAPQHVGRCQGGNSKQHEAQAAMQHTRHQQHHAEGAQGVQRDAQSPP